MSALSALLLLPAALLLDRLFGEPPARIHPVCGMGALAAAAERLFRRGPDGARMTLAGLAACLAVILPVGLLAALPVLLAGGMLGDAAAWIVSVAVVSLCLAPRCLDEHARRVALPLERGDLEAARRAVAMLVGKATGTGAEFSLLAIVDWQQGAGSLGFNPVMIPALLAYLIFLPGTMGVPPFDIPEAETEVLEGPLLEYGGPLLALFQIGSALKTFVVLGLGVALFFPGTISDFWIVNLIWFVFKCLVLMLLSLTLVKSATGRFRIDQAFRFYVKVPTALALVSLVLVWAL